MSEKKIRVQRESFLVRHTKASGSSSEDLLVSSSRSSFSSESTSSANAVSQWSESFSHSNSQFHTQFSSFEIDSTLPSDSPTIPSIRGGNYGAANSAAPKGFFEFCDSDASIQQLPDPSNSSEAMSPSIGNSISENLPDSVLPLSHFYASSSPFMQKPKAEPKVEQTYPEVTIAKRSLSFGRLEREMEKKPTPAPILPSLSDPMENPRSRQHISRESILSAGLLRRDSKTTTATTDSKLDPPTRSATPFCHFNLPSLSSILRESDHLLACALIHHLMQTSSSFGEKEKDGPMPTKISALTRLLLSLHGDAPSLFMYFLMREVDEESNFASVMRERSLSVYVLQRIWRLLDITEMTCPLNDYLKRLHSSKVKALLSPTSQSAHSNRQSIKKKLSTCIMQTLRASAIPRVICGLCHQSVVYIMSRQNLQSRPRTKSEVAQWAVGSLIFLRFLIPSLIVPVQSDLGHQENQKGKILLGRLLMKLCCKSSFKEEPTCMLNEVIQELSPHFDSFCDEVVEIGANESICGSEESDPSASKEIESDFQRWKTDLFEFLTLDFKILVRLMKRYQAASYAPTDPHDIICRFKNEISDSFGMKSLDADSQRDSESSEEASFLL